MANINLLSNGLQPCRPLCATAELLKIGISCSRLVSNWKPSKNGHKFRRRQLLRKCVIPDLNETGPTSASRQKNALRIKPRTCVRGCLMYNSENDPPQFCHFFQFSPQETPPCPPKNPQGAAKRRRLWGNWRKFIGSPNKMLSLSRRFADSSGGRGGLLELKSGKNDEIGGGSFLELYIKTGQEICRFLVFYLAKVLGANPKQ